MNIQEKYKIIKRIAHFLNEKECKWAIGGSLLLTIKGLKNQFNDVDIMTTKKDFAKIDKILSKLGEVKQIKPSTTFQSTYFKTYHIKGLDVDLMAEFKIFKDQKLYEFSYTSKQQFERYLLDSETLYLDDLEQWLVYYQLSGRIKKSALIDSYLKTQGETNLL